MWLRYLIFKSPVCISAVLCGTVLVAAFSVDCAGQNKRRKPERGALLRLPRVGTIKDYPATGLMTGCGNSYFYFAYQAKTPGANYVFIANGDGRVAWMNLNGRDVRLKFVRSPKSKKSPFRTYYRWGKVSIEAVFEEFKPQGRPLAEDDPATSMKIILRQGRFVKTVRALGDGDC